MMSSPPSTPLLPSATAASLLPYSVSRRLCFAGAGGPATARRRGGSRLAVVRASSGGDLEVPIEEGIASDVLTKQTTVQDTGAASNFVETIQGAGFKLQTLHAEKTNPFLADWVARLSFSAGYSTARYALSSTDYTDSAKDLIHAANRQEHDLMRSIFHLQEVAFSCTWKAGLLGSFISYVLPPSCLAEPCEQDYSLPNMPLLFAIAMVGATVGGLLARQRRGELKRLNDQLRQINAALRRQAKIESYAPTLSYAPVGSKIQESDVIVDPQKERLIVYLRSGKNHLRNQAPDKAFPEFKAALDLAQSLSDHVEEKKAARGLGASLQRQGKYKEAIKYHSMVLNISKMTGEDSGVTEAYGAIADCYTELGELEKAGEFYDKYISRLQND